MGHDNMDALLLPQYRRLLRDSPKAWAAAVLIAKTTLDPPGKPDVPPCVYFASWEHLAIAMGMDVPKPDATDKESVTARETARKATGRIVRRLIAEGLLKQIRPHSPGRPTTYELMIR